MNLYDTKGFNRLQASLLRRADSLDLGVAPKRKPWFERLFNYLGNRKGIIFSNLGIIVALFALLFGDNIYEQFTGRSIFAANPVPTLTSTATVTLAPERITPSRTLKIIVPSRTPTLTVTSTSTFTPTPTFTLTTTITSTPTISFDFCTWRDDQLLKSYIREYQCYCTKYSCTCSYKNIDKETKEYSQWELKEIFSREEADQAVRKFKGSCQ